MFACEFKENKVTVYHWCNLTETYGLILGNTLPCKWEEKMNMMNML